MAASTSSSGPVVKRPRISSTDTTSVSERRRFVPAWKSEFPWVVLVEGAMRCQYVKIRESTMYLQRDAVVSISQASHIFPRAHARPSLMRMRTRKNTGCSKLKKDVLKKLPTITAQQSKLNLGETCSVLLPLPTASRS